MPASLTIGAGISSGSRPGRRRILASSSVSPPWRAAKRVGAYSNSASSFGRPQISRPPLQRLLVVDVDVADDHPARGRVREHDQLAVDERPRPVVGQHHAAERARLDQRGDDDQLAGEMPGRRRVMPWWASTDEQGGGDRHGRRERIDRVQQEQQVPQRREHEHERARPAIWRRALGREHAAEHARDEDVSVAHARVVQVEVLQLRRALDAGSRR